jgi:pimeloyl-ACP methyl ester carboxylesterase
MRVLLIPGFWLNAQSWDPVAQALADCGHEVEALNLPGMSSKDESRRDIGLRDHVAAVVAAVDRRDGHVVLVGHSAGGAIAHAVADARPERVARVVYVDSVPLGNGDCVNAELPVADGEIPLPDWSVFGPEDMTDLSDELRAHFRDGAIPVPAAVATDLQELHDPRRYEVPSTIIACGFSSSQLRQWIDDGQPWTLELAAMKDVDYVDLPTGHWPQFTRPDDLADAVVSAVGDFEGPRD